MAQDYLEQCSARGVSRARLKVLSDDMGNMDLEIDNTARPTHPSIISQFS